MRSFLSHLNKVNLHGKELEICFGEERAQLLRNPDYRRHHLLQEEYVGRSGRFLRVFVSGRYPRSIDTIAFRDKHTDMIDAEHRAGTLSDWERTVIFERFTTAYGTRNLDEAKQTLASTWNSV